MRSREVRLRSGHPHTAKLTPHTSTDPEEGMLEGVGRRAFGCTSSGTYNVRASELARHRALKTLRVQVTLLDDSTQVFEIEKQAKGQALLDLVFNHLELIERDFFGLQYIEPGACNTDNPRRWLDPRKPVKKQLRIRTKSLGTFHQEKGDPLSCTIKKVLT